MFSHTPALALAVRAEDHAMRARHQAPRRTETDASSRARRNYTQASVVPDNSLEDLVAAGIVCPDCPGLRVTMAPDDAGWPGED